MSGDPPTEKDHGPATQLAQAGRRAEWTAGVVNPPVYRASTHAFETLADLDHARANPDGGFYYGRRGAPTQWALQDALTEMEPGAAGTKLFPSGLAAVATAVMIVAKPGAHVLIADSVYEPTRAVAGSLLKQMGAEAEFYDPRIGAGIANMIRDETSAIFMESPGSLTYEVQDVPAICTAAKGTGIVTVVDNSLTTSLLFQPIRHGADIALQSLSKFVGGHSDIMLGSLTANRRLLPRMKAMTHRLGQVASPDDAFLASRGLRTLAARMKRHSDSCVEVAAALVDHPAVAKVHCPALPGSPDHALWSRDIGGASSLFTLEMAGGVRDDLASFVDHLAHFSMGFSYGGFESLVVPVDPAPLRTATEFTAAGPLLRVHIGLEDPEDLIADLTAGLERYQAAIR